MQCLRYKTQSKDIIKKITIVSIKVGLTVRIALKKIRISCIFLERTYIDFTKLLICNLLLGDFFNDVFANFDMKHHNLGRKSSLICANH